MDLYERYPALCDAKRDIEAAADALIAAFEAGGKLLLCGNGGSCADCEHIVGELMKGFMLKRPLPEATAQAMKSNCPELPDEWLARLQGGLPAISLPSAAALNSAFCNDVDPALVYAQPLMGLAKKGDALLCISTSGNSENVVAAAQVGKALGLKVIALTGCGGGALGNVADVCICVPEQETYKVQELHLPVYHHLCAQIERHFFG